MKKSKTGFVYIFANSSLPGWVKIGKSADWTKRVRDGNTYTPCDFYPVATLKTADMGLVEKRMHTLVGNHEQSRKEFFLVDERTALNDLLFVAEERGEAKGFVSYENGLPAVGYKAKGKPVRLAIPPALRSAVFHSAKKGSSISMKVKSPGAFVVQRGSVLEPMTAALANSDIPSTASIRAERQALEANPKKVKNGKLVVNVEFTSASRALAVMLGCSAMQGPSYWLDDKGKPLADYL